MIKEAEALIATGKKEFVFSAGFGASGLPHIGTFGEIIRTNAVIQAMQTLDPSIKTELIIVSDDMDGLRKIPENIPNYHILQEYIGYPLTSIPDPTNTHNSFGEYINNRLIDFLSKLEVNYTLKSATTCYKTGVYNQMLLLLLKKYDDIMNLILPTLGEVRQASYSPCLPICPETGRILQVKIENVDANAGNISYLDHKKELVTVPVINGNVKLQWKPDWGMRWAALKVDYEMHGKDLSPSAVISSKVCKILDATPPKLFKYEMFLDKEGKKISKSKGNGISVEEWGQYAPIESLSLYLLQNPSKAKKLHFSVIPKSVDDFISLIHAENNNTLENLTFYIEKKHKAYRIGTLSFAMMLNLASACNPEDQSVLLGFVQKYCDTATLQENSFLTQLIASSFNYYLDHVLPYKEYKTPNESERIALKDLADALKNTQETDLQTCIFSTGKKYFNNIQEWFVLLYEVLFGQKHGPNMGSFISLYGKQHTIDLITSKITSTAL